MASTQTLQALFAPPPSSNWSRHAYHASAIVGDYIYIDGGDFAVGNSSFNKSGPTDYGKTYYPVLPIHSSWSDPLKVQYQVIPKPRAPVYNFATLWHDEASNTLFSFGGEQSYLDTNITTVDLAVWRLDLDGKGNGTWIQAGDASGAPWNLGITRPFGGVGTFTNDTGYYAGGYTSKYSSPLNQASTAFVPTPGIVSYSFGNSSWTNDTSTTGITDNGSFEWGGMEWLPTLGPNGMIVFWGGETSEADVYVPGAQERPMDVITLLDPITKQYYTQRILGTAPPFRNRFCSVNVEDSSPVGSGANKTGTWEIFMYSGYEGIVGPAPGAQNYDEIWALSIPAFTWTNVYSSQVAGRVGHTCHLVGNRQLLSIGGVDASRKDVWGQPDFTNNNGLAVFDLSMSEWQPGYNANADVYQRPTLIHNKYDQNGSYPAYWTDPNLQKLLINNSDSSLYLSSAPLPTFLPSSPSSNTTSPTSAPPAMSHTTLIAITTSIGILVALLPFLLLYLFHRRRRNIDIPPEWPPTPGPPPSYEISSALEPQEMRLSNATPHGIRSKSRLDAFQDFKPPVELDGQDEYGCWPPEKMERSPSPGPRLALPEGPEGEEPFPNRRQNSWGVHAKRATLAERKRSEDYGQFVPTPPEAAMGAGRWGDGDDPGGGGVAVVSPLSPVQFQEVDLLQVPEQAVARWI